MQDHTNTQLPQQLRWLAVNEYIACLTGLYHKDWIRLLSEVDYFIAIGQ